MVFVLITVTIILFIIAVIFSFPQFSPIPYFPSNKKDISLIIKALGLTNNQIIIDLGAGDGIVVFEAAKVAKQKGLNTRFIGIELNPVLITILYFKRLLHPNKKNVEIIWSNFFKMSSNTLITNHQSSITFYLYISPWLLNETLEVIKKNFPACRIISYMYPIKVLKEKEVLKGKNNIYIYAI